MKYSNTSARSITPLTLIVVFVVSFFLPALRAQEPPDVGQGTYPSAVYFGNTDFESVDMTTGRLDINIPLLADKSQRGNLNFPYSIPYSSTGAWVIECEDTCWWYPASGLPAGPTPALNGGLGVPFNNYPWTVMDSSGAVHALANLGSYYESVDASGIQATIGSQTVVTNKSGIRFVYGSGGPYIEDTNGNLITFPGGSGYADLSTLFTQGVSWTMYDTVGRSWSLTANVSPTSYGCPNTSTAASVWTVPSTGASGGTRQFAFCYSQVSIHTSLGGGYMEYSDTASMLSAIVLPDGTMWQLSYNTYGDIAQIDLPTGGSIAYTYNSTWNSSGYVRTVASRTVSDGVNTPAIWTYQFNANGGGTVTDPSNNETVYTATTGYPQNPSISPYVIYPYITSIQYYSGSSTLLKTVTKNWSALWDAYNPMAYLLLPTGETTALPNNQVSQWSQTYDSGFTYTVGSVNYTVPYGLVTSTLNYDWGSGAPGTLLTQKYVWYMATEYGGSYLSANLLDLVSQQSTYGNAGECCFVTYYGYDQSAAVSSGVSVQHTSPPGAVIGNLTSIVQWDSTTNSNVTTATYTNYDTGMLATSSDALNNKTSYYYANQSPNWYGSRLTTITNALGQSTNYQYDWQSGLLAYSQDLNGNWTNYVYDNMFRPTQINYPDGGQKTIEYSSYNGFMYSVVVNGVSASYTMFDGLGRPFRSAVSSGESSPYNQVDSCYDAVGNIGFQSYPYQSTGLNAQAVCSSTQGAGDTLAHDTLGRITRVTHSDGSAIVTSYGAQGSNGRATCVTDEGTDTGQVERCSQVDGLGRMTSVCEITTTAVLGNGGTPGNCNQDIANTGFLTTYAYDAMNNLVSVMQGGINRTFSYDSLSRLSSASNPESGTITFSYSNPGALCAGDVSLPCTRADARGITTTYAYDTLNRMLSKNYSDGTPEAIYTWGNGPATVWGHAVSNPVGNLISVDTYSTSQGWTASLFSFDAMGRRVREDWCIPAICTYTGSWYSTLWYTYDLAGDMVSSTNGEGVTLSYSYNSAQLLTGIASSLNDTNHPGTLFSGAHYNAAGSLTSGYLDAGLIGESRCYEGRMRLSSITDKNTATNGTIYSFNVPFPACGQSGIWAYAPDNNIVGTWDSVNGSWSYAYDPLNRLASANTSGQSYTYGYDRFGNRWQQNGPHTMTESFSGNNNRMDGYSYEAAGNLLSDGTTTYTYDAENRVISASNSNGTTTYVYDGDGRRVRKTVAGVVTDYLYDVNGNEVAAVNGSGSWIRGEVYAAGRHIATYTGGTSGNTYFNLTDNLGTERVRATIGGSSAETCTSLPFGDWLQCSGSDSSPMHFTGYERDSESGLDNASARYYGSPLGRFMTPDPAGMLAADPTNPQSWNMYSYVLNNPLRYVDPTGTDPGDDSGEDCDPDSGTCLGEDYQPAPVQLTACGWNAVLAGQCTANPANVLSASCGWDEEATGQCSSLSTQCPLGVNGACLGIPLSSGNSTPQSQAPPWYKNSCVTGALGKGALSVGIDSIGLIPEAGGIARVVGHQAGYVGVVADQAGSRLIGAVNATANTGRGLAGLTDTSPTGLASTGLTIAGFIPGLNDAAAVGSIGLDLFKTAKAVGACY